MIDQKDILEAIADGLALPVADIDTDSSLKDDLGLNPVEMADLLSNLSKKFNIIFDPSELEHIKTVGDLVVLVEDKLLE
jgi:acyl carrier protein